MIKHANKILYVGTGLHIMPVTHFPETKQFIFIDSQPRSEFDSSNPSFHKKYYRQHFINELVASCQYYGFELTSIDILDKQYYKKVISSKWYYLSCVYKIPLNINPALLVFTNNKTNQTIRYYISTNIKFNMNEILQNDISTCDGIIISDYFPETNILQYFIKPKKFFGYTDTCYHNPNDNIDNIIYFLKNCVCNTPYYFTEFYMIYNDSGVIIKCENFNNFLANIQEYDDFILQQQNNNDNI